MKLLEGALPKIKEANRIVNSHIHRTPIHRSRLISDMTKGEIYLKLENFQKTGSFKMRGATYKMSLLSPQERRAGVITASAGNHAQATAYAAKLVGAPATVVMPENASITKVEACRDYGAEVIFHGNIWDESFEESLNLAGKKGLTYIHPFDDIDIIAGQGTLGLEIHEALKDVEIVAVPIGGGGLISGVTLAIKSLNPNVKIYGVQSEAVPSMKEALKAEKPVKIQAEKTIADGLAAKKTGDLTFKIVRDYVEDVVTVSDEDMSRAIFLLLQRCKILVEAAGSASVAAMISGKLDVEGKKTVAVLSGGNIDLSLLSQIIDREFVRSGRIMRLRGVLSDVPGELSEVLGAVSETRGNVLNIEHNRLDHRFSPGMAEVIITVDISSGSKKGLMNKLKERGYDFKEGATST